MSVISDPVGFVTTNLSDIEGVFMLCLGGDQVLPPKRTLASTGEQALESSHPELPFSQSHLRLLRVALASGFP